MSASVDAEGEEALSLLVSNFTLVSGGCHMHSISTHGSSCGTNPRVTSDLVDPESLLFLVTRPDDSSSLARNRGKDRTSA